MGMTIHRVVALRERFENPVQFLQRHADAGVSHLDRDVSVFHTRLNGNFLRFGGEFYGVF